jgi:hypothetical protein
LGISVSNKAEIGRDAAVRMRNRFQEILNYGVFD